MDRCLKIEHARFHGGLHLAGFDTGVLSSRAATAASERLPPPPATQDQMRPLPPVDGRGSQRVRKHRVDLG